MKKQKVLIFSHGFGSRKDDRGIFTSITDALPGYIPFMFDYSRFNKNLGTLTVTSISHQAEHFKRVVDSASQLYPNAEVNIIAHSQGCLVAAMQNPGNISKAVFLTPVTQFNEVLIMDYFSRRTGASKNRWGKSLFPRKDGSRTIVPREYWDDMAMLQPQKSYDEFCKKTHTDIIYAKNDEVLSAVSPEKVCSKYIKHNYTLNGDHSFSNEKDRNALVKLVCDLMNEQ